MSEYPALDTVTLEWIKFAASQVVTEEFADSVRPEFYRDQVWGRLVHQITVKVLADQLPPEREVVRDTFTVFVPKSPWQQFKLNHAERWWLRWLVRRRPVRQAAHVFQGELVVDLTRYQTFPEARISGLGPSRDVVVWKNSTRFWEDFPGGAA